LLRRGSPGLSILLAIALLAGCGDGAGGAATTSRAPATGDGSPGKVELAKLGDFDSPLFLTQPPGERRLLFVVEKDGVIRVLRDGKPLPKPFLDIRQRVNSKEVEQGLLSLAFAPDYRRSHRFYVAYTGSTNDVQVIEMRSSARDPLTADRSSARHVIEIPEPAPNHNGGLLLFGPDRLLYLGTGDGGPSYDPHRTAQSHQSFLGKILRIDPRRHGKERYSAPQTNPFVGDPGWNEVFVLGLRNPWRFSFDRKNGDLLVGDVGQDKWEEIDYRPRAKAAGSNFGWSAYEANRLEHPDQVKKARGSVRPILTYRHGPGCSVTGGYVVRSPALPSLYGRYLYGDFCAGELRSLVPALPRARDDRSLGLKVPALSSFAEDGAGNLYALSLNGPIYRILAK
jgi:glucose/arabinose dehydrogenase